MDETYRVLKEMSEGDKDFKNLFVKEPTKRSQSLVEIYSSLAFGEMSDSSEVKIILKNRA